MFSCNKPDNNHYQCNKAAENMFSLLKSCVYIPIASSVMLSVKYSWVENKRL